MGKGKGLIERKVIRIRRGVVLFEFLGVNPLNLKKLIKKINKYLNVKFFILSKEELNFNV